MSDNIPVADKRLQWIAETTARFAGYLEFQRRPAPMLDWWRVTPPRQLGTSIASCGGCRRRTDPGLGVERRSVWAMADGALVSHLRWV